MKTSETPLEGTVRRRTATTEASAASEAVLREPAPQP